MSERKKTSVWPWIVAVMVLLPVLYLASYGPAFRYNLQSDPPEIVRRLVVIIYTPTHRLATHGPAWIAEPYIAYLDWWHRDPSVTAFIHKFRAMRR